MSELFPNINSGATENFPTLRRWWAGVTAAGLSLLMDAKPQLVTVAWTSDGPITYKCSLCDQTFVPPDNPNLAEEAEQLLAIFQGHVREMHSTKAAESQVY